MENEPPAGEAAVQWHLLTPPRRSCGTTCSAGVWRTSSGCSSPAAGEHLTFRTADRLQRAIAINGVIAWRIIVMTLLGRQVPNCAAALMFTDHELGFLSDYARKFSLSGPDSLGPVRLVAHLGGYRDRKHDPEPGSQLMWHGYDTLTKATLAHQIGLKSARNHATEH